MKRVLRWIVSIDVADHPVPAGGPVVAVAADLVYDRVEFWTIEADSDTRSSSRLFRVFGTGHVVPDGYVYRGTAPRTSSGLVWHLWERVEE